MADNQDRIEALQQIKEALADLYRCDGWNLWARLWMKFDRLEREASDE